MKASEVCDSRTCDWMWRIEVEISSRREVKSLVIRWCSCIKGFFELNIYQLEKNEAFVGFLWNFQEFPAKVCPTESEILKLIFGLAWKLGIFKANGSLDQKCVILPARENGSLPGISMKFPVGLDPSFWSWMWKFRVPAPAGVEVAIFLRLWCSSKATILSPTFTESEKIRVYCDFDKCFSMLAQNYPLWI